MMKRILVVGGANGIGLSIATELAKRDSCEKVYIVDKVAPDKEYLNSKMEYFEFDLTSDDYSIFDKFDDIDTLMITAGFGRLALFKDISEEHITSSFAVNAVAPIRIIHHFMDKLQSNNDFYCGVMVSIAGFLSSPFFAVYGATKAALKIFIYSRPSTAARHRGAPRQSADRPSPPWAARCAPRFRPQRPRNSSKFR